MEAALQATKRCQKCFQLKPLDQFRLRCKELGNRFHQCNDCHNAAERVRRAEWNLKEDGNALSRFQSRVKETTSFDGVEVLYKMMLDRFAGLDGFVDAWMTQLALAADREPGSKRVLDFFLSMTRILQTLRQDQPSTNRMSDEELEKYLWTSHVLPHLRDDPQIIVEAAEEIGWTVIPPSNGDPVTLVSERPPNGR